MLKIFMSLKLAFIACIRIFVIALIVCFCAERKVRIRTQINKSVLSNAL